MIIKNITSGSKVTVTVRKGEKEAIFETTAAFGDEKGLYIEPFRYDDKLISFEVPSLRLEAVCINDNTTPYQWNHVKIKTAIVNNKSYHLIETNDDVNAVNRRGSFRVFIGIPGIAQLGQNKCAYNVMVKDISVSGVAFVCGKDVELSDSDLIHLKFEDTSLKIKFNINCKVARKTDVGEDEKRVMYGCSLVETSDTIAKYIAAKQMETLKKMTENKYQKQHKFRL